MLKKILVTSTICTAIISTFDVYAFEFGKPIVTKVLITNPKPSNNYVTSAKKEVTLMNIQLTPKQRSYLFSFNPIKYKHHRSSESNLPSTIDLGMNDVPVLDQGYHGTCVTFAITAALDALLKKGDYISQLCSLELGAYLQNKSFIPGGWDGSFGAWVTDQIVRFGIVNKENQQNKSCAKVTEYPGKDWSNEGSPMSIGEFSRLSEDISDKFYPIQYMNFIQRFETRFNDTERAEEVLTTVKKALNRGNRLAFGTFIVLSPYCSAGACASYKEAQDTWALTSELLSPPFGTGGHEMVIFGYDDNATAVDSEGKEHKGLLMLRNSWGAEVGDHGNYYMTYDYFKKFVGEVQEFVAAK